MVTLKLIKDISPVSYYELLVEGLERIRGDFNEILDDSEKDEGRRKSIAVLDEFRKVIRELALVDVKLDKGWYTWTNNRGGNNFVRERLNRFLVSTSWLRKFPFLSSIVLRQACSDHDVILLN